MIPTIARRAVIAATFALTAIAGAANAGEPSIWTPHIYSLGGTILVPVVITSRVDQDNGDEDVVVTGQRRAQRSTIFNSDTATPQAVFNIGGDLMRRLADCTTTYTTAAGQPTRETDLAEHVGARSCYF